MTIHRNFAVIAVLAISGALMPSLHAQDPAKGALGKATSIKCTFPLMAASTLQTASPEAKIKPSNLTLEFDAINTDEGTAEMKAVVGKYDIVVRYASGYLHLIQSFLDGPLYTTTIIEKKTAGGKFKAMHSRHEYTDVALPGITSSPEQYYGECEVLK